MPAQPLPPSIGAQELFEASADGLLVVGGDGTVRAANSALLTLTGWSAGTLVGQPVEVLLPDRLRERHRGHREGFGRRPAAREMGSGLDLRVLTATGELVPVDISLGPLPSAGEGSVLAVVRDVRDRRAREDEWQRQALHDPLTGLANRTLLLDRLEHAVAGRRRRHERLLGVFFLDVDGFKQVNDRHGHAAGDEVLRAAAQRLAGATRPSDTVARVGGDEFVVVTEDLESAEDARAQADRLRQAVEGSVQLADARVEVRCSIGQAVGTGEVDAEALLAQADSAMYADKAARRADHPVPGTLRSTSAGP